MNNDLPWNEIHEIDKRDISFNSFRKYLKRPLLKTGETGQCPVCSRVRSSFCLGLCVTCYKAGKDISGEPFLLAMFDRFEKPETKRGPKPQTEPKKEPEKVLPELELSEQDQPAIKRSIVLDYGTDELELRGNAQCVDIFIRQDEDVVWAIKNLHGAALAEIKKFLGGK